MLEEFRLEQPIPYKIILNSLENDKISHAYLFESNGYSKALDFAIAFSKTILCPNKYLNNEKCSNCSQCKNIDSNEFLELKVIEAEGQWLKNNQLEELQFDFSKKSLIGNKKIYIINGIEKLNVSSANSILKFLEEPEEGIIAILITENLNQILDTIKSRCQIISLKNKVLEKPTNFLDNLGNNLFNNKEEKNEFTENSESLEFVENILNFIKHYEDNKLNTIIYINNLWHKFIKEKSQMTMAFNIMLLFYKDILNYLLENEIEIYSDYVNDIKYIASKNKINNIILKINVIIELKEKIKFNANNNLLMDKLIIELERCEKND